MDRTVPSEIIEQWIVHLRRQRSRALDLIWLIEKGASLHDGRDGVPTSDATARWLREQEQVVIDVDVLLGSYESINV
jgi:hypothetical protein